jgi:hypothetical protein
VQALWSRIIVAVCKGYYADETKESRLVKAQVWGANQRFWAQMCMAAKVGPTIRLTQEV